MGLEVANNLEELDQTWPTGVDPVNKGDDHLRLLKKVLKEQFPGVGGNGFAIPITALEADLNNCIGSESPFQEQINDIITNLLLPIGTVVAFAASFATIPAGWFLCDGDNGTVNLTDQFIMGTATEVLLFDSGGSKDAVTISHSHGTAGEHQHSSAGAHNHDVETDISGAGQGAADNAGESPDNSFKTSTDGAHTHAATGDHTHPAAGVDGTDLNLPPFVKLAYIQRII